MITAIQNSYFFQVFLTLYEKDIPFAEHVINIQSGEQNQNWYLAINKNGEVPVLKLDDRYIAESETIIDVIDETFTSGKLFTFILILNT